jgi:hypothetical protein
LSCASLAEIRKLSVTKSLKLQVLAQSFLRKKAAVPAAGAKVNVVGTLVGTIKVNAVRAVG